jgi:hypothetical protein
MGKEGEKMSIRFECIGCGRAMKAPDAAAGKRARCPQCKTVQVVPEVAQPQEAGDLFGLADLERTATAAPVGNGFPGFAQQPPPPLSSAAVAPPPPGWSPDQVVVERAAPRRRSRPRPRYERERYSAGSSGNMWLVLTGIALLLGIGAFAVDAEGGLMLLVALGLILSFAGGIWFLVIAFQDSAMAGVLCLLVPFYSLYYLATNWDTTHRAFALQMVGTFMYMALPHILA